MYITVDTAKQTAGMPVYMFANLPSCELIAARRGLIIDMLFGYFVLSARENIKTDFAFWKAMQQIDR